MLVSKFADPSTITIRVWENDGDSHLIVDELLKHLACKPASKIEELRRQIALGDHKTVCAEAGAKSVGDIARRTDGYT